MEINEEEEVQISDERWVERKREFSRKDFILRFNYPFVLLVDEDADVDFEFRTQTTPGPRDELPPAHRVLPLRSTGANPYRDRIIVGRTRNCDVMIRSRDISKYHADFRIETPTRAVLRDRKSSNGTTVGDRELEPNESIVVNTGDRIRFGSTPVLFLGPGEFYDLL
ncbi:MAG: FHA domain-containing protein [Myxococcota bacterium]